jgi:hypothetical protein
MKKVLGFLVVAAALASCSVLDQKVTYADGTAGKDDPIGLKGKVVTVSLLGNGARTQGSVSPLAVTTTSGTFEDISGIPAGVALKEWGFELTLTTPAGGATLSGTNCPASITVTLNSARINVKNQSDTTGAGVNVDLTSTPSSMTLNAASAGSCTYAVPATPIKVAAKIAGAQLSSLVNIISAGGTNAVTATVDLSNNPSLAGRTIGLNFGSGTGYVIAGI